MIRVFSYVLIIKLNWNRYNIKKMKFCLLACVLVAAVNLSSATECGLEGSANRIYKGSKVRAHKYPWLAHIRSYMSRSAGSFGQCGGSLIDEQHIATAAHCVYDNGEIFNPKNIDVFLGMVDAFTDFNARANSVSKVWIDPKYNPNDLSNDFAILTLSNPVKFSSKVSPICLPNSEDNLDKLIVSGWGTTSAHTSSSNDLLEVDVSYIPKDECADIKADYLLKMNGIPLEMKPLYKDQLPEIAETHMCAINQKTMGDACSGDSGGPLMHKGSDGRWYLMGVVSGSWTECGESKDTAGLYTRTLFYQDIIKDIASNAAWKDL